MARSLNHATTQQAKDCLPIAALNTLAIATLEKAARDRFGAATSVTEDIDHVVGFHGASRADIEKAKFKIDGDTAEVTYGDGQTLKEVRVNGHWRFDLDSTFDDADENWTKGYIKFVRDQTALAQRLAKEVADGKYKSEDAFKEVMAEEMKKIVPEEMQPPATAPK